ncbi:MAG: [Fe-Fe] hydrogenase large subunit C-terminal domain-containing protein [Candidatus Cloacimonadales bacterium]
MNTFNIPIYTEFAECQDCYKCVRECPVKAIKIEDYHASIIPELCIHCGHCVEICPVEAKQVRNDLARVKTWLRLNKKIVLSLAPAWRTEFPKYSEAEMVKVLQQVGFSKVSETALGAEEINAHQIKQLQEKPGLYFSSACPVVTKLIEDYYPDYSRYIMPLSSPLIAHAKLLKQQLPEDYLVVFAGPCFAKKREADENPSLISAAITFQDLWLLFHERQINPKAVGQGRFFPAAAQEGSVYPIDGGMISGIKQSCSALESDYHTISGIKNIINTLSNLEISTSEQAIFVEMMACEGGCVNGPGQTSCKSYLQKRVELINYQQSAVKQTSKQLETEVGQRYLSKARTKVEISDEELNEIYHSIGKDKPEDLLNCGSCGYNSCRNFAQAIHEGKAEAGMCMTYLRKRAQKKANALFRTMPSGVVIVDDNLQIIETNQNFSKILKLARNFVDDQQDLAGAYLAKLLPFADLFEMVLKSGEDILEKEIQYQDSILNISIFTIEKKRLVGGIVEDITKPSIARAKTNSKAKEVIRKNLDMVQKIAYLLGENAAEVEMTLNSIIDVSASKKNKITISEDELR